MLLLGCLNTAFRFYFQAVQRAPPELPPMLPGEVSPDVPEDDPVLPGEVPPPKLPSELLPELPELPEPAPGMTEVSPELPPDGGVVVVPGLVSVSVGGTGGIEGIDSGADFAGGGMVLVPPCSVPLPVPLSPPPRLQPARLNATRPSKIRIFDVYDFVFIPIPFN